MQTSWIICVVFEVDDDLRTSVSMQLLYISKQIHGSNPPAQALFAFLAVLLFPSSYQTLPRSLLLLHPPPSAQSFPPLSIALPALQTYSTPLSSVCVLIWPFWAWIPASAHSDRAQLVLPLKAERCYRHCVLSDRHLHNAYSPASLIFTVSEHSLYIFLCYIPHNDPILSRVSYLIGSAIPEEMWRIKKENENTVRVK